MTLKPRPQTPRITRVLSRMDEDFGNVGNGTDRVQGSGLILTRTRFANSGCGVYLRLAACSSEPSTQHLPKET